MAFQGQSPKAGGRQRRGTPVRGEWETLEPLERPILPELDELDPPGSCFSPDGPEGEYVGGWPKVSCVYWSAWRQSPVTAKWTPDDIALAIDTIYGHADAIAGGRGIPPSEVRLRMESLGLTPKGRVDRRWKLPEDPKEDGEVVQMHVVDDGRTIPEAM